jgi:phosphoglycolate phosphatase
MIDLEINGATLENIELIIFDKDGTLFELYPYWSKLAVRRGENICKGLDVVEEGLAEWIALQMGVDIRSQRMNPKGPTGIYDRQYIQNLLYNKLKDRGYQIERDIIQSAFKEADEYISNENILKDSFVPVKGLCSFLDDIKGRCKGAMFSYDLTDKLELIARFLGISDNFDMFLGGDKIIHPKPDPWGAIKIMSDLHVAPENTALMGDSIFDLESGRRANCNYLITILSEISNSELLKPVSNAVLNDFTEISVH